MDTFEKGSFPCEHFPSASGFINIKLADWHGQNQARRGHRELQSSDVLKRRLKNRVMARETHFGKNASRERLLAVDNIVILQIRSIRRSLIELCCKSDLKQGISESLGLTDIELWVSGGLIPKEVGSRDLGHYLLIENGSRPAFGK